MRAFSIVLATLLAAATPALAAPSPTDRAVARQHYEKAVNHFNLGEFPEAAVEFREVYKVAPQPVLLYDAAQAYRLANDRPNALVLYQSYLHLAPTTPHKAEVLGRIQELQAAGPTPVESPATSAAKTTVKTATTPEVTQPLASTPTPFGHASTTSPDAPPSAAVPATKESDPDARPGDKHQSAVTSGGSERLKPVTELIRKNRAGFRACFDKWSAAHPGIDGAVTLSFYLAPDGNLDHADADARGKGFVAPDVESCIEEFARTLHYPAATNGKFTRFNYPFDFKAATH
jgi:hypothetical protein